MEGDRRVSLPDYVERSPLVRRKRALAPGQLSAYIEKLTLLYTPSLLPEFFRALHRQVQAGDKDALKLVAQMYEFVKTSGISIVNTLVASQYSSSSDVERFDEIVRRLEQEKQTKVVNATPVTEGFGNDEDLGG